MLPPYLHALCSSYRYHPSVHAAGGCLRGPPETEERAHIHTHHTDSGFFGSCPSVCFFVSLVDKVC